MLSRAAVASDTRGVVEELGRMQAIASRKAIGEDVEENPWKDVPDVLPVEKLKVRIWNRMFFHIMTF